MGISTVIDLREEPDCHERRMVEEMGMRYVNIPMTDTDYPDSKQIDAFLALANEPTTGRFFVHCAGGRHRTGVIGAVYRLTVSGWNFDQVYSEMKSYDFYTRWGHSPLKRFVQDYAGRLKGQQEGISSIITL
jgi:protein tyrosine/serine phosphatase